MNKMFLFIFKFKNYMIDERLEQAIRNVKELFEKSKNNADGIKQRVMNLEKIMNYKGSHIKKSTFEDQPIQSQTELERMRVDKRLKGFQVKDSIAWKEICKRFGSNLNQVELLSIAEVIGNQLNIKVDREAKRRKEVLIKWFDENYSSIGPFLDKIVLEDRSGKKIEGPGEI